MTNFEDNDKDKQASNFAKYTGIAFQMLATIGLFAFIGYKIDENSGNTKSIYTAMLGLLGVVMSLFMVIRSLTNKK
ncbi:AtpZ/AtpI family protein [Pedobacter sp. UC225_61]|uniref:AtpZ/AtpI family protein n=1 Tax=Pedobacter sp. UC225_61 TaxID=3374623 RepID=UPI0037A51075